MRRCHVGRRGRTAAVAHCVALDVVCEVAERAEEHEQKDDEALELEAQVELDGDRAAVCDGAGGRAR